MQASRNVGHAYMTQQICYQTLSFFKALSVFEEVNIVTSPFCRQLL